MADSQEPVARADTALVAESLGKRVPLPSGELTILDGVGFTISRGEAVAIVGASGSGKSTLLSLLAGLDLPTRGHVELGGERLDRLDEDGRARVRGEKVGFVFQNFQLLPSLTALENVMLPLELRGDADCEGPARAILAQVGLGERLRHYPRQLSGGEQQRVALARALAPSPGVLLLDEPFSAIDPERREDLGQYLVALQRRLAIPMIFVTHSRSEALQIASTIVLLRGGRLIEAGEPRELYSRPRFEYTARFLGPLAALGGETWKSLGLSDRVPAGERAMLRPEEFEIRIDAAGAFEVAASLYRGWDSLYILRPGNAEGEGEGVEIPVRSTMDLQPGQRCALVAKAQPRILEPPPPLWY